MDVAADCRDLFLVGFVGKTWEILTHFLLLFLAPFWKVRRVEAWIFFPFRLWAMFFVGLQHVRDGFL